MSQESGPRDLSLSRPCGSTPVLFLHFPFQLETHYQVTSGPITSGSPGAPINAGALFTILCRPGKNPSLVLFKKTWPERELKGIFRKGRLVFEFGTILLLFMIPFPAQLVLFFGIVKSPHCCKLTLNASKATRSPPNVPQAPSIYSDLR